LLPLSQDGLTCTVANYCTTPYSTPHANRLVIADRNKNLRVGRVPLDAVDDASMTVQPLQREPLMMRPQADAVV